MSIAKLIGTSFYKIRKGYWSAPVTMGFFILVSMFIVFGSELLGLTNREINLDYRIQTPEKIIPFVSNQLTKKNRTKGHLFHSDSESDDLALQSNNNVSEINIEELKLRNRLENIERMNKILLDSVKDVHNDL